MIGKRISILIALIFTLCLLAVATSAQRNTDSGIDITIPVTVHAHSDRARALADSLEPADFLVYEEKRLQQIVAVRRSEETPVILSLLIQEDLVSHVGNEIKVLKRLVTSLPHGSRVMIGYLTAGSLRVSQEFTDDRERAAEALRPPVASPFLAPYFLYTEVRAALRSFEGQPQGRRVMLIITDGLDQSNGLRGGAPIFSLELERAISEAQRQSITVYGFYAPSVGLTGRSRLASNYGQSALNRLCAETGGEGFFSGFDFVTFDPYLKELKELLDRQWLITYHSPSLGEGFRTIEVKTDLDLHLNYPEGYRPRTQRMR